MRARRVRCGLYGLGLLAMVLETTHPVFATVTNVPEIDGGSVSVGLGLLAAGALMLRARLHK